MANIVSIKAELNLIKMHTVWVWRSVDCRQQFHCLNVVKIDLVFQHDDKTLAVQFHS